MACCIGQSLASVKFIQLSARINLHRAPSTAFVLQSEFFARCWTTQRDGKKCMVVFDINPSEGLVNVIAHAHGKAPRTHSDTHIFPACRCFIFVVVITNCIAGVVEKFRCGCRAGWVDPGLLPGAGRQFQQFWQTQILDCYQAPGPSSDYTSSGRHRAQKPCVGVIFGLITGAQFLSTIHGRHRAQKPCSGVIFGFITRAQSRAQFTNREQKKAHEIAQFRASFTNHEHKESTRTSTISSTIHKSRAHKKSTRTSAISSAIHKSRAQESTRTSTISSTIHKSRAQKKRKN